MRCIMSIVYFVKKFQVSTDGSMVKSIYQCERGLNMLGTRKGLILFYLLMAPLLSLFLGLFLLLAGMDFGNAVYAMYVLFCAPATVSAFLMVLTPISENLSYGFGCGLYYGTCAVYVITIKLGWTMPELSRYLLGFIIASLVCYIVWLNKYKSK